MYLVSARALETDFLDYSNLSDKKSLDGNQLPVYDGKRLSVLRSGDVMGSPASAGLPRYLPQPT